MIIWIMVMSEFFKEIRSAYMSNFLSDTVNIDRVKIHMCNYSKNSYSHIKYLYGKWRCYNVSETDFKEIHCKLYVEILDDFVKINFNDTYFKIYSGDLINFKKCRGVYQKSFCVFDKDGSFLYVREISLFYNNSEGLYE